MKTSIEKSYAIVNKSEEETGCVVSINRLCSNTAIVKLHSTKSGQLLRCYDRGDIEGHSQLYNVYGINGVEGLNCEVSQLTMEGLAALDLVTNILNLGCYRYKMDKCLMLAKSEDPRYMLERMFGSIENKVDDSIALSVAANSKDYIIRVTNTMRDGETVGYIVYNCLTNKYSSVRKWAYERDCREKVLVSSDQYINKYGDIINYFNLHDLRNYGIFDIKAKKHGFSVDSYVHESDVANVVSALNKYMADKDSRKKLLLSLNFSKIVEAFNEDFNTSWEYVYEADLGIIKIILNIEGGTVLVKIMLSDINTFKVVIHTNNKDSESAVITYGYERPTANTVYMALTVATMLANEIYGSIHNRNEVKRMRIICIHTKIPSGVDVEKLSDTLSKMKYKKLDRYTTGSVLPGNYYHISSEFIKSHSDKLIMDTDGLPSGVEGRSAKNKYLTIRPFGSKNYFVLTEEAGLDALSKEYPKQVVPVVIGDKKEGWNSIEVSDINNMVSDIMSL